jgi:rod shape-determining protein MreC
MRIALPIKAWAQRFAFALLIGSAVALLALSRADLAVVERVRGALVDVVTPLLDAISRPVQSVQRVVAIGNDLVELHQQNQRLREENARLLHWQEVARRLEQDNLLLRKLVQINGEPLPGYVSARVVGDAGGPFVRTMLMTAGQRDGLKRGDAVMADLGMVGRVVDAGQRASRVLLITDLNSRIPVMVEGSRHRAILSGDNSPQPRLDYLPSSAQIGVGERIVTSGDGGALPPGLPIGEVVTVADGQQPRVRPLVDLARLEIVRVVRFESPRPENLRFGGQR